MSEVKRPEGEVREECEVGEEGVEEGVEVQEKEEDIETPLKKKCTSSPSMNLIDPAEAPATRKERFDCGMDEILAAVTARVDNPAGNGKTARRL
jgi:hypothetical protein